ncbi:MAG TPA: group II intron reverse transcriptase/maturase [Candidatus Binatia bacterium]|jgi:RNA-directed DNA polymerase|nr:group II intron reverse transcriptase/maturase [Candidatus Binatia bacterium]
MMHEHGKSDRPIVPAKAPNEAEPGEAKEVLEGRGLAKGKAPERNMSRTQSRTSMSSALERIRQAARRDKGQRFTALLHHVYSMETLKAAYFGLKRDASAGIDGTTWRQYGERLESRLLDLSDRVQRGAYRAEPVRRAYIPKAGDPGKVRALGVLVLEDKIVQRATAEVLSSLYEQDFVRFSYGFRPKRSPHQALDALSVGIVRRKVNWVLDADIRGFFDTLDHEWLVKFVEHRVADRRVVRLIQKWLNAGVLEEGKHMETEMGTIQGGSISPLLANIYLHYVFDLWVKQWRKRKAHGDVIVVRFADDFVIGFEHRGDGERFLSELIERLKHFGLELHTQKTRLIEFGRNAEESRRDRGERKPETFNFLGFTHSCAKTRKGKFVVLRQTMRKRWQAKLKGVKAELRGRMHKPVPEMGRYVRAVITGHMRYYAVPMNAVSVSDFRIGVARIWRRVLKRRSQKAHMPWTRMQRYIARWVPQTHVCHPYPWQRFGVIT